MNKSSIVMCLLSLALVLANNASAYDAPHADKAPNIDGNDKDDAWAKAEWSNIDQLTLGSQPSAEDFSGRYKVVWTEDKLYLMAEIVDDILIDTHADPLDHYWDDDTLEIFLDEDKSGGNHLDNYNAFAYHIALDNQTIDFSSQGKPRYLNDHVHSVWKRDSDSPNKVIWETAIDVYPDTFKDEDNTATPVKLSAGKEMGFMLAYCDSDGNQGREHFIGSYDIPAVDGDKNRGYIDASVFDSLILIE